MDSNDRQAIDGLFSKLAEVQRSAPPRDAESEAFIRDKVAQSPAAPYYMAQTIVVQEQALNAAQARIEELEGQAAQGSSGGLLGSLFGGGRSASAGRGSVPRTGQRQTYEVQPSPWQRSGGGMGGGGFLAGAAQTAMGVAGGVLLGNAIAGMFGADEAQAAESAENEPDMAETDDAGADDGGGDFDGGDMEF